MSKWKVLFCGHMMRQAFKKTSELVQRDAVVGCDQLSIQECASDPAAVLRAIQDVEVAIPLMSRLDERVLDSARNLRLILQFGVGVEGVDIAAASERGIMVSNMPSRASGNALSCAEHAIMLMLMLLRDWGACQTSVRSRKLGEPTGETMFGKTVLVVGFGHIAHELIPRLKAFGARVNCVRKTPWGATDTQEAGAASLLDDKGTERDLPRMLPHADLVVIAASQSQQSLGLVNHDFLARCRAGVHIVNVARGGLLDYSAVLDGLGSGHIGGLALDVHWREPFDPDDPVALHPRCILTPHIAGVTHLAYSNMARTVIAESLRVKAGEPPSVWLNSASYTPRQR